MEAPQNLSVELECALTAAAGISFSRAEVWTTSSGSISRALEIRAGEQRYFLKLNDAAALPMFEAEVDGLAALAACNAFRVPRVLASGATADEAFLLLEWLQLRPLASAEDGQRFAEALAKLHHDTGERFGWARDNFIGANPQTNVQHDGWARFFVRCRLTPQLQLARSRGHGGALGREADQLLERVPALFLDYRPRPSLLHGDLWSGNAAIDADGTPVIFDPAVYRGDREADLAMSELFGGFPTAFYAAYRTAWPLDEGYEQRKALYNLYHVLNHLNLFGRSYLGQAERMIRALVFELRR
ncbi:predicted fructosamine kinase [Aromatoleum aromaticum EbN1]|uniref:Predicted fructosamine kinase n=1 Tax=Aromatoleum aromaticum (strain DSM 19018 / LMG 30748 / EbN1) TaxID=76114 RepID=Q5NYI8_AROAE|nr:fructosamine kinase family protein [Aromatoleum aromaticum]CAI09876.1 predicted fructosamine kinase [Aromatoleum aromaticum EbN1]